MLRQHIPNKNWLPRITHNLGSTNLAHAIRISGYLHSLGSHSYNQSKWAPIEYRWKTMHSKLMERL